MKYKLQKHGQNITLTTEGVEIEYKNKKAVDLGDVDIKEGELEKTFNKLKKQHSKLKKQK